MLPPVLNPAQKFLPSQVSSQAILPLERVSLNLLTFHFKGYTALNLPVYLLIVSSLVYILPEGRGIVYFIHSEFP